MRSTFDNVRSSLMIFLGALVLAGCSHASEPTSAPASAPPIGNPAPGAPTTAKEKAALQRQAAGGGAAMTTGK